MRKVPKLRFKEFSDELNNYHFIDIGKVKIGLTHTPKYVEKGIPFLSSKNISKGYIDFDEVQYISKEEFESMPKSTKPQKGDILFTRVGSNLGNPIVLEEEKEFGIFVSLGAIKVNKNFNNFYIKYWIDTNYFWKQVEMKVAGGAKNNLNTTWLNEFKLSTPSLQEQEKIANFLSSVDKKISLTEEKLELFREYKKGVMQKIFSQELRFKDSNGNDYPEWEEKSFDEVYTTVSNKEFQIKNSEILNIGKYRVIDQGKEKIAGYSNNELKVFKDIPIIVYGDHTTNVKFVDFNFILGGDGTKLLTVKNQRHLKFLYFALDNYNITPEGYKRHFSILKEIILYIPSSLEEQEKIADFLSSIDSKIESIEKELEGLKEFKKGLLQQMFV